MKQSNPVCLMILGLTLCTALTAGYSADLPKKEPENFTPGEKGRQSIRSAFTKDYDFLRSDLVLDEWKRIVAEGQKTTNVTTASLFSLPNAIGLPRSVVLAQLGKPQATNEQAVPGMRNSKTGEPVSLTFYWYGALGMTFFGPADVMAAISYDPKRDKPQTGK